METNGTLHDRWNISDTYGECINDDTARCPISQYAEWLQRNNSMIGPIMAYEPCNYASNIAYYHATTKVCDYPDWTISPQMINNFKRSFATLTSGSANMHGSHTYSDMLMTTSSSLLLLTWLIRLPSRDLTQLTLPFISFRIPREA